MPERDERNSDNRAKRLAAAVRHRQRARHDAEPQHADKRRKRTTMGHHPTPERESTKTNGDGEARFVDRRVKQESARGSHHGDDHEARQAVSHAKPGQADREPIESLAANDSLLHASILFRGASPWHGRREDTTYHRAIGCG